METPMKLRSAGLVLVVAAFFSTGPVLQSQAQGEAPVLAVAEIQYVDTSGEVVDQSADHFRRLREFEASLRTDLAASGKVRNVALDCPPNACSVGDIDAEQLLGKAQAAGAEYLLISSFHKMSTLVQWAKVRPCRGEDAECRFQSPRHLPRRQRQGLAPRGILHRPGNPGSSGAVRRTGLMRSAAAALPRSP